MPKNVQIGKRFRQIRSELSLNQTEMGKLLKKKQRAISHYEYGRIPDQDSLKKLQSLGFSIDWLLSGVGEMHLKRSEVPLELDTMTFLDTLADGVLIIQDGVHKYANQAVTKITGYSLEEHENIPLGDLTAPEMKDKLRLEFRRIMKGEHTPALYKMEILCKDGSRKEVHADYMSIQYEGKPALLAILRDVTSHTPEKGEAFSQTIKVLK